EPMHRVRSRTRLDLRIRQGEHHAVAPKPTPFANTHDVTLICVPFKVAVRRQRNLTRERAKKLGIASPQTTPFGKEGVKFGHLRHADGRLDVGEAQVKTEPAKRHHGPGPMRLERRIWRAGRAMIAQASNKTGEIVTTRRDDAALTGGHYLARMERE